MGSHSLISTARAESHWFIRCPNQAIWSSNAVLFRIEKKSKLCLVTTRVAPAMVHTDGVLAINGYHEASAKNAILSQIAGRAG
jgi:hypothetical protein